MLKCAPHLEADAGQDNVADAPGHVAQGRTSSSNMTRLQCRAVAAERIGQLLSGIHRVAEAHGSTVTSTENLGRDPKRSEIPSEPAQPAHGLKPGLSVVLAAEREAITDADAQAKASRNSGTNGRCFLGWPNELVHGIYAHKRQTRSRRDSSSVSY